MRYWAASGRLGTDAAYDTGQMKVGRRLAMKVLNASKFALITPPVTPDADAAPTIEALLPHVTQPLDVSLLTALRDVVENATKSFETWDYTRSLEVTETFFWTFCDDYIELVKDRETRAPLVPYNASGEAAAPMAAFAAASVSPLRALRHSSAATSLSLPSA